MSDSPNSPPKDVEHGGQSPDDEGQMDNQDPHSAGGAGGYEFEVKEQDRWLPIANGKSSSRKSSSNGDLPATPLAPPVFDSSCYIASLLFGHSCLASRLSTRPGGAVLLGLIRMTNLMLTFETLRQLPEL